MAFLLEQGIPAERILLLTFTNKAAKEMMRRVADLLGQELESLWGGTFHSIGNRILRRHAAAAGIPARFLILDREDARHLINTCVAESGYRRQSDTLSQSRGPGGDLLACAEHRQAGSTQCWRAFRAFFQELSPADRPALAERYAARKRATNAMDFDDLLALWLKLLQEHDEVREHYQRRFQFVLVDEYQDTNQLQSDLIDLLAARHKTSWWWATTPKASTRGAARTSRISLNSPNVIPGAKIYKIETNYRSTPEILERGQRRDSRQRTAVRQGTDRRLANPVQTGRWSRAMTPPSRPRLSRSGCWNCARKAVDLNQMAVLYRSHFHALELQLELTRRNIPFRSPAASGSSSRRTSRTSPPILKLVNNPRDELSFKRLVQLLPGVGGKGGR